MRLHAARDWPELREMLLATITHVMGRVAADPSAMDAYEHATTLREDLDQAVEDAADLRAGMVARVRDTDHLSIASTGQRLGLTKARVQDMLDRLRNGHAPRTGKTPDWELPDLTEPLRRVRRIPPHGAGAGSSFAEQMTKMGLTSTAPLSRVQAMIPPPGIAVRLDLRPGEQVLERHREMRAEGRPIQLATSYIPLAYAGSTEFAYPDTGPAGIYQRLADRGLKVARFTEEIATRPPTKDEAEFFLISRARWVLEVTRIVTDRSGRVLEVVTNILPGNLWQLIYDWPADE